LLGENSISKNLAKKNTKPLAFDLSFEQLEKYQGTNPRPEDFDTFWDLGLKEMHATDSKVKLIPSDFQLPGCQCFHLYFSGVHGARLHAKYLRPTKTKLPHPAVLLFHGYTGNSGDWVDKLGYVSQGFTVAALDCRGQGGLSEDTGRALMVI